MIPRLSLVQNVGELCELFEPGQIVLNKETVLVTGNESIELTVLNVRKVFMENIPFDSDERPAVYNTLEEVKAVGGTVEWGANGEKPDFVPVLHTQVLIKAPASAEGAFPFEYKGDAYAIALWSIRGTAYSRAGKNIMTAARFSLKDGIHNGKWSLGWIGYNKVDKKKADYGIITAPPTRTMKTNKRRMYRDDFKKQIVKLYENGKTATELGREYGVSKSAVYEWAKRYSQSGSFKAADNLTETEKELVQLRKENKQLLMENDILKQAALIMARK